VQGIIDRDSSNVEERSFEKPVIHFHHFKLLLLALGKVIINGKYASQLVVSLADR